MKKKLFTSKIKTLLVAAVALAIVTTVIAAVAGGTTLGENVVGTLLQPLRSGVAAIDRQATRIYNYIFSYEALEGDYYNVMGLPLCALTQALRKWGVEVLG